MLTNTRSGIQHGNHFTGVVGLMAPDQLRFIDHFVKNADTGRINWYRLFNVVLPYTQSSSIARKLPEVWLMINMDSKWAGQANDDRSEKNPVRNSNQVRSTVTCLAAAITWLLLREQSFLLVMYQDHLGVLLKRTVQKLPRSTAGSKT